MSATTGGQTSWSAGSKPGQSRRHLAAGEAERGGGHGIRLPATIWTAEATSEEPKLVHVFWGKWERQGRPELTGIKLEAEAGVRLQAKAGCGARGGHPRGSAAPSWHQEHDGVLGRH